MCASWGDEYVITRRAVGNGIISNQLCSRLFSTPAATKTQSRERNVVCLQLRYSTPTHPTLAFIPILHATVWDVQRLAHVFKFPLNTVNARKLAWCRHVRGHDTLSKIIPQAIVEGGRKTKTILKRLNGRGDRGNAVT